MDIIAAYQEVGTYRGAADICGTTHKTVRRVIERAEAGEAAVRVREERPRNYDAVAELATARAMASKGRMSAKRLLPIVRAAGYEGSARNFRRLVSAEKALWRRDHHRGRRPALWSPGEYLVIDWATVGGGLHLFCAVLAWSRWRFVAFATDEKCPRRGGSTRQVPLTPSTTAGSPASPTSTGSTGHSGPLDRAIPSARSRRSLRMSSASSLGTTGSSGKTRAARSHSRSLPRRPSRPASTKSQACSTPPDRQWARGWRSDPFAAGSAGGPRRAARPAAGDPAAARARQCGARRDGRARGRSRVEVMAGRDVRCGCARVVGRRDVGGTTGWHISCLAA